MNKLQFALQKAEEFMRINDLTDFDTYALIKEALEQKEDYLYVYKGSEIWLKDSLDIPSAGFLIGKIRLEK